MPWGSMGEIWAEVGLNYAGLSQGMRDATAQVRTFDREISSSFKAIATGIGDSLSEAGRSLSIGITVPLTAFGGLAAKMSADFETAMANVWTITDISKQELQGFGQEIEALSLRVPQSAKQLADGLYDAISSGIRDVGEAIGVVEIAAKAAQAGMSDTATAVDALTSVLNSYGLAADQAGVITDMMFRTVDRGKITFGELAGSIGQVVSTAATANVAFEEIAAAYATLTRGGIGAAEASTAINQAILSIINPSQQAAGFAKQLGIEFNATALASKGFAGVLEDVYEATGGNIEAITTLFPNIRALKGVLGLIRNDLQDYTGDLEQMATATGATEAAFAKQMETSAAKAQLFKNEVAALTRSLGNELWPILISIMDALKPIIQAFTELPAGVKEAAVAWGLFAVALGPVMSGLGALIGFLTGPAGLVLAISAVVAGIYGWVSASRDIEGQIDRQVSSAQRAIREAMEQARAYGEQSNQLDKLIREYEELEGKPDKSEQEHERLRQVIDAIVQLAPQAVTGYDDMGRALIGNAEAAKRVRDELWQLRKEQLEIAAMRAEYELPMLEEQLQLLEPQFARTKRELDEIAPRYFKMREVVQEITRAATSAQKEQILQAATLEGVFDAFTPPATQFAVMEQRYNKLYSVFTELSSALFKAQGGVIELKNAQQELDDWLARKPGETVVAAAKSAVKTAKETVDTITEEELSEFEKFSKKIEELSEDVFGELQDEWTNIAKKLESTDPVEVSWAEQRARALLNAIHGAIAQFEGDWTKAAEAAAKEVASGYESIKEKAIEGQTELAEALSEFRHRVAVGEFLGVDVQLAELERIKGAYEGTAEEIQHIDEQLYRLREQMRSKGVRDALSYYQFEAQLYDYSAKDHANHLRRLLESEQLTADERKQIVRDIALYEKRARDEAEKDAKEADERAARQQEQAVRDRIQAIQRQATLEEWSYERIADAVQGVLDTETMSAELRSDLAYQVALNRKKHADEAAAAEKRAAEEATRAAEKQAKEQERLEEEQARAQDERVRGLIEGIQRTATLHEWSYVRTAAAIQEVLDSEVMSTKLRADLEYQVALNRKRAADEVAKDAEKQAEDARRRAEQEAKEQDDLVKARVQGIQRVAQLEDWGASQTANAIQGVLDAEEMSAELRVELAWQVALNRKRAAEAGADAEKKATAESIAALDREFQFRRQLGTMSWEQELEFLKGMAFIDGETRTARMSRAVQYYSTVSGFIQTMEREEAEAMRGVLVNALETFAAMGEAGEEMVLVISAALGEVDQKLIAKTDSWAATLATSFAESLGELGSLITAFKSGMESSGGDPIAAAMQVWLELVKKSKTFAVLLDVINPLVQAFADTVGAVLEPLIPLVMVLSEILTPAIRGVAKVFGWVADIVVGIWNALANTINFILGWLGVNIPTISPTWREDVGLKDKDEDKADAGGRRGTQISEITGPTRDLLIETLRPLTVLDSLPVYAMAMETAIYEMRDAFLTYVGMKAATEAGAAAVVNEYHISTINIYSSGKEDFDQLMGSLNRRAEIALLGSGA